MSNERQDSLAGDGGERLSVGPWSPLAGGRGTVLAVSGDYTAAAELSTLTVWADDRLAAQADAPSASPGRPRFALPFVFWGGGVLDLHTGTYTRLTDVNKALIKGTDAPSFAAPGRGYLPSSYAWAPGGEALVVSAAWGGDNTQLPSRAVLVDGAGGHRATLWEAQDLAPVAAWLGRRAIVLGTREPLVFDRDGRRVATLHRALPAKRIESSDDETKLMTIDDRRIALWDTSTWELRGEWPGMWLDAALAPDGRGLVAVAFDGRLHYARTADGLTPVGELLTDDPVAAVAHGDDRIVASFISGASVRTAPLVGEY